MKGTTLNRKPLWHRILVPGGWKTNLIVAGLVGILVTPLYVPAALAFPHRRDFGNTTILASQPIPDIMAKHLARADRLLAASPINDPSIRRTLVFTNGDWRWDLLAFGTRDAIALRRPLSNILVFNKVDMQADRARNLSELGGVRTLSGTIAHETTHTLVARRYGEWRSISMPRWKREGYADFVAQETSLGPNDEELIRARFPNAPILEYYAGRRRVAAELARNGNSVDSLLGQD